MNKTFSYDIFTVKPESSPISSVFNINDYNSVCLDKIKTYLSELPSTYFGYIKVDQGIKIEKLCYDYYEETDLYDLILLLNNRDCISDMTYPNDIVISEIENDLEDYKRKCFNTASSINVVKSFSDKSYKDLYSSLETKYDYKNNKLQYIKVIKKNEIYKVLSDINEIISNYQNNINLLDME